MQGNLDPALLLGAARGRSPSAPAPCSPSGGGRPGPRLQPRATASCPTTPAENVERLVEAVHRSPAREPEPPRRSSQASSRPGHAPSCSQKYDRPGPRYTSYPTAVEFHERFAAADYRRRLGAGRTARRTSRSRSTSTCRSASERCTFCGCNVVITQKREVARRATSTTSHARSTCWPRHLPRPAAASSSTTGAAARRPTSTRRRCATLQRRVTRALRHRPRRRGRHRGRPARDHARAARRCCASSASTASRMGVQDFDPEVQEAIDRNQTLRARRGACSTYGRAARLRLDQHRPDLRPAAARPRRPSARTPRVGHRAAARPRRGLLLRLRAVDPKATRSAIDDDDAARPGDQARAASRRAIDGFLARGLRADRHGPLRPARRRAGAGDRQADRLHRNFMGYTVKPAHRHGRPRRLRDRRRARSLRPEREEALDLLRGARRGPLPGRARLPAEPGRPDPPRRDHAPDVQLLPRSRPRSRGDSRSTSRLTSRPSWPSWPRTADRSVTASWTMDADHLEVVGDGRLFIRNICMVFDGTCAARGERPVFSRTV